MIVQVARTRCHRFEFAPDFINHNDFGIMVFNRFNHHFMLTFRVIYLHTPRFTNSRVRHIAITTDFVAGINNHYTLIRSQNTRRFTEHGCFTNPRRA